MRPSSHRIQAILNMSVSQDMGMVNYLQKFIPYLASIDKPLRELLEKSVEWHWMEAQQKAYGELITCITPVPLLKYFDENEDVIVSVDASSRVWVPVCCKGINQ